MTERAKKIKLVDIDPDNWRSDPQVAEAQKHYVANSAVILARAYAYHNQRSRTFIIYVDETPVACGFIMICRACSAMISAIS